MTMPDITHTWTQHTYTEPFAMTQEIRIPLERHGLDPQARSGFLWRCYTDESPRRVICWGDHQWSLDPDTGEFWMRLRMPLSDPMEGTIVLTGMQAER